MKTGDSVETTTLIRSQKTGVLLPRQGTFVRDIENLGRKLILVDFGSAGEEYLFPDEVLPEAQDSNFCVDEQDELGSFQSGFNIALYEKRVVVVTNAMKSDKEELWKARSC